MTTAPAFEPPVRPARGTRPPLPRLGAVLREQVHVTGLALRVPAMIAAGLVALVTLWVALQGLNRDLDVSINAWPTQIPGLVGALLPLAVWARDDRFGAAFLWTLPVDRRTHALTKVAAGWVWLMVTVALFVLWLVAVTTAAGGRLLPETLQLVTREAAVAGPIDPATLRSVRWTPGPLVWLVPFTSATACYLLASAFALGSRFPLRWLLGVALAFVLVTVVGNAASDSLGVRWLDHAPERLLDRLFATRWGLDAVLTARLETLAAPVPLTTGEYLRVWWGVPRLADWGIATLGWTGAGLLALLAAASRHRERRRA